MTTSPNASARSSALAPALLALAAMAALPAVTQAQSFRTTFSGGTFAGSVGVSTSFNGTMTGNYNAATNYSGTRVVGGLFGGVTAAPRNDSLPFTGTGGTGSSGNGQLVNLATSPTGTSRIAFNRSANTVEVSQLTVDAIGTTNPPPGVGITANVLFTNGPFRTFSPNYTYPLFTSLPIPLGNATISGFDLSQSGAGVGTITPTGPDTASIAVTVPVSGLVTVDIQGVASSLPTVASLSFTGTVNFATNAVSLVAGISITEPIVDVAGTPQPFALPAPSTAVPPPPPANVLLTLNLDAGPATPNAGSVTTTGTLTLPGTLLPARTADIANTDGDPGADGVVDNGDFQAFFSAFFLPAGNPAALVADVANTDGDPTPDGVIDNGDFQAFFASFFEA